MRKKVFIMLLTLCSIGVSAQEIGVNLRSFMTSNKSANNHLFPDKFALQSFDNGDYVPALLKIDDSTAVLPQMRALGCRITASAGKIHTAFVPVSALEKVIKLKGIAAIDMARKVGVPNLKRAVEDVNADYVHQGLDLPQGYTGKGVIIGDADWGTDYTHPMFYDTVMDKYRVLAAWDQFRTSGNVPQPYGYGAVFTTKDELLTAQCDTANIYNYGNHATHVGGIMGGAGAGTQYRGVAYESDLLFATWKVTEADVMNSYSWMRDVAKAAGKRLIINNSWGIYYFGGMDGRSLFDEFVKNMSDEDSVVFTASAGNNGDVNFHIAAHFASADTLSSEFGFNFPAPYSENYWGETVSMTADSTDGFSAKITMYNSAWDVIYESAWVSSELDNIANTIFVTNEGDSLIYNAVASVSYSGRAVQEWSVRQSKYIGNNYHTVLSIAATNGTVHAWNVACLHTGVGNWGLPFMASKLNYLGGDTEYSIGEPAIGEGMISVAAYSSGIRNSTSTPSNIAYFSSKGPNLNNIMKPEIAAPGVGVISSYSSFTTESYNPATTVEFEGRTYPFAAASGTSMSCPVVSGIIALMLEANPALTPSEVRDILLQTAREDEYTHAVPNYKWGFGKVDAWAAVKAAVSRVGLSEVERANEVRLYPNPTNNIITLESASQSPIKSVKVCDITGRELVVQSHNNTFDLSSLKAGVYFLNISFDDFNLVKKVIKQ
ncbi:MAG: S8 family peptidase [Bacteroidales bacterium]|jgi:subtilisin family serine protease|nr:S8 family peptidase [Bacteroidales bacterium]